ncbi:Transposable element Tcb1 transposase [Nosema granulosis]|uniref:Transposable element Tcb1 transposase n=1 Tax=Nosema granulosis TaxID=83296 RepID=A0A9P6GYK6_9MICR|nr:Transposable element Tcb1 transposase [Nosema granulosis]
MTIKRLHYKNNRFAYSPIKKPLLSKNNIISRHRLAEDYHSLSDEEVKSIILSDESKLNLFYTDGTVSVWRKPGTGLALKNLSPTVKRGGGSIMVWGCFSYQGVGNLVFIEGKMNSMDYINILSNNLPYSAANMGLSDYTFQQDNDPKHKSKATNNFFRTKR